MTGAGPNRELSLEPYRHEGRQVHRVGEEGSPVVLLHELGGLADETFELAEVIAANRYQVHLPLLFGKARQTGAIKGAAQLCLSREFAVFRSGRSSPIAEWIRSLCRRLAGETSRKVGVVGMCATGGLVLSVVYEESVGAAVACQPALPLRPFFARRRNDNLGASTADVANVRASGKPLLMMRFTGDIICPAGRQSGWEAHLGGEIANYPRQKSFDHALLTYDTEHAPAARQRLIEFLNQHLGSNSR